MPRGIMQGAVCATCGGPIGVRNKLGYCIGCRTDTLREAARSHDPIRPWLAEQVAYYAARAELGLPLFEGSPWARLPGAHNRALEAQPESAGATGRIAPTREVKKLPE